MTPIALFRDWYEKELSQSAVSIPSACCLSTNGLDDYPNARMVSLKVVTEEGFIITGATDSLKGKEIEKSNAVALTFWMGVTEKQVRIQGNAHRITGDVADQYFEERNTGARLAAIVCQQGVPVASYALVEEKYRQAEADHISNKMELKRPEYWGGYIIRPIRIELMAFKQNRLHERQLFSLVGNTWQLTILQP